MLLGLTGLGVLQDKVLKRENSESAERMQPWIQMTHPKQACNGLVIRASRAMMKRIGRNVYTNKNESAH